MALNPKSWAETFSTELTVAGVNVPLDRVIARHREAIAELRRLGMTWRGISTLLIRAGARRADGGLISSDQLRVGYARCAGADSRSLPRSKRTRPPARTQTDSPSLAVASSQEHQSSASGPGWPQLCDKDVSGSEVEAALARLSKIAIKGERK